MSALTWIGFVGFFLAATVVGVRLVALWWRTRQLPELLIASGVLGIGTFGFAFSVFAMLAFESHPGWARVLWGTAMLAMSVGGTTTYVFTWIVFRHPQLWARAIVVLAAALFAGTWLAQLFTTGFAFHPGAMTDPITLVASGVRIGALAWASIESLAWWRMMRRRGRLGMGNPVVENRFLLWGVGIGAAALGSVVGLVVPMLTSLTSMDPVLQLSSSLHGLAAAVAMWLAFLPPPAYLRWVESRAAAVSA